MLGQTLTLGRETGTLAGLRESLCDATSRLMRSHDELREKVADLQSELEVKNRQLKVKDRLAALGQISAAVAHEIRNPLGGIGLYADLLRKELEGEDEKLRLAQQILSGVKSLNMLVEGMLEFANPPTVHKAECNVGQVVYRAVSLLRHEIESRDIEVEDRCGDAKVLMDSDVMFRAFTNIILNAVQAMGAGGKLTVDVNRRDVGGTAITFADTGPGIPSEAAEKIFDPFFTLRDGGTGLGLSIVHSAVESHGGTVEIGTAPEGGAVFAVILPENGKWQKFSS